MRLGTKNRLAVDTMIDLGLRDGGAPVPLAAVCARLHVSLSYLEQVVAKLRQHGLLTPTRGPGGGYALARPAAAITLAEIVEAVHADADPAADDAGDTLHDLAARLADAMRDHMAGITLASLCEAQLARGIQVEPRPPKKAQPPSVRSVKRPVPNSVFAFGGLFR